MQAVVAAHLQPALVVGNLQLVVGVRNDGVDRLLMIVDDDSVESLEPIALKHLFRGCPVSLAALNGVGVAVVVVR